ncbi:hypothetical protein Tco_0361867, partial [Tanacetum coccineum]
MASAGVSSIYSLSLVTSSSVIEGQTSGPFSTEAIESFFHEVYSTYTVPFGSSKNHISVFQDSIGGLLSPPERSDLSARVVIV